MTRKTSSWASRLIQRGRNMATKMRRRGNRMGRPDLAYAGLEVFASIVGFLMAPLVIYVTLLWLSWSGLFHAECPTVLGRECNWPHGRCMSTGFCECVNPTFAGDTCSDTLCPGYDPDTSRQCLGRGQCNPLMSIPTESPCREKPPTRSNGYRREGGWGTDECQEYLKTAPASEQPRCQCVMPFYGEQCADIACPIDTTNQICSGNGDRNVDYWGNDTEVGKGCQCRTVQWIRYDNYSIEAQKLIIGQTYEGYKYEDFWEKPYCGEVIQYTDDYVWVNTTGDDLYKCYCDEEHYGETCWFGTCPKYKEKMCAGHGHPYYGYGFNPTAKTSNGRYGCEPRCHEGGDDYFYQLCPSKDRCVARLKSLEEYPTHTWERQCATPEVCPTDRPVRCADGSCVSASPRMEEGECGQGYVDGTMDRVWNNKTQPLVQTCHFSTDSDRCGFTESGCVSKWTRLQGIVTGTLGDAQYRDGFWTTEEQCSVAPSVWSRTFTNDLMQLSLSYMVLEGSLSVIWNRHEEMRLDTLTDGWQTIQVGPYSTPRWSVAGQGVLSYDFIVISADRFQTNRTKGSQRVFSVRTAVDLRVGEEFKFDGVLVTTLTSEGDNQYYLTMVPGLEATFLEMMVSIPPRTQAVIERRRTEKNTLELRWTGRTHVDEVRVLSLDDAIVPCVCPACTTTDELNRQWYNEPARSMAYGKYVIVKDPKTAEYSRATLRTGKVLTDTEYYSGCHLCPAHTPFRCPSGNCASAVEQEMPDTSVCHCTTRKPTTLAWQRIQSTAGTRFPMEVQEGDQVRLEWDTTQWLSQVNASVPYTSGTFPQWTDTLELTFESAGVLTSLEVTTPEIFACTCEDEVTCECSSSKCVCLTNEKLLEKKQFSPALALGLDVSTVCQQVSLQTNCTQKPRHGMKLCPTTCQVDVTTQTTQWLVNPVDCPQQLCPFETPYRCDNGVCVDDLVECETTYFCYGNGCYLFDANKHEYGCICDKGYSGPRCEFHACSPATPLTGNLPGDEVCHCGGPPPLREHPPKAPVREDYTTIELGRLFGIKKKQGMTLPFSSQAAPFGNVVMRVTNLQDGPEGSRLTKIYTTCPFARKNERGEYTLEKYDTAKNRQWDQFNQYDEYPYRCENGKCVSNPLECALSNMLYPLCNGRGTCMGDGTCECSGGVFRTFIYSEGMTVAKMYPYAYRQGTYGLRTYPDDWEGNDLNDNWLKHSKKWCMSRDCRPPNQCEVPMGCFAGTPSLNFQDRLEACRGTNKGYCGRTQEDCAMGRDLEVHLACSGRGIKYFQDYSMTPYCYCGQPKSPFRKISDITQISELEKNGFGGDFCNVYECSESHRRVFWSSYDYEHEAPWKTKNGLQQPGRWVGPCTCPVGPDPNEADLWSQCGCDSSNIDLCEQVPCQYAGNYKIECVPQQECTYPDRPLVYSCHNHGTCRMDGTCECDTDEISGKGYTDNPHNSDGEGCDQYVECARSERTGRACNRIWGCSEPDMWPDVPVERYFEQQKETCYWAFRNAYDTDHGELRPFLKDGLQIEKAYPLSSADSLYWTDCSCDVNMINECPLIPCLEGANPHKAPTCLPAAECVWDGVHQRVAMTYSPRPLSVCDILTDEGQRAACYGYSMGEERHMQYLKYQSMFHQYVPLVDQATDRNMHVDTMMMRYLWDHDFQTSMVGIHDRLWYDMDNWCSVSLSKTWPHECGHLVDPETRIESRYCATTSKACDFNYKCEEEVLRYQPKHLQMYDARPDWMKWVKPACRIRSKAPENVCVLSTAQHKRHQAPYGTCVCDRSFAGSTCECPAVNWQYTNEVCGGFGSAATVTMDPTQTTKKKSGRGTDQGCFAYNMRFLEQCLDPNECDIETYFGCVCEDIGRSMYTALKGYNFAGYPSGCDNPNLEQAMIKSNCRTDKEEQNLRRRDLERNWYKDKHLEQNKEVCKVDTKYGQTSCLGPAYVVEEDDQLQMTYLKTGAGPNCACPATVEVDVSVTFKIFEGSILVLPEVTGKALQSNNLVVHTLLGHYTLEECSHECTNRVFTSSIPHTCVAYEMDMSKLECTLYACSSTTVNTMCGYQGTQELLDAMHTEISMDGFCPYLRRKACSCGQVNTCLCQTSTEDYCCEESCGTCDELCAEGATATDRTITIRLNSEFPAVASHYTALASREVFGGPSEILEGYTLTKCQQLCFLLADKCTAISVQPSPPAGTPPTCFLYNSDTTNTQLFLGTNYASFKAWCLLYPFCKDQYEHTVGDDWSVGKLWDDASVLSLEEMWMHMVESTAGRSRQALRHLYSWICTTPSPDQPECGENKHSCKWSGNVCTVVEPEYMKWPGVWENHGPAVVTTNEQCSDSRAWQQCAHTLYEKNQDGSSVFVHFELLDEVYKRQTEATLTDIADQFVSNKIPESAHPSLNSKHRVENDITKEFYINLLSNKRYYRTRICNYHVGDTRKEDCAPGTTCPPRYEQCGVGEVCGGTCVFDSQTAPYVPIKVHGDRRWATLKGGGRALMMFPKTMMTPKILPATGYSYVIPWMGDTEKDAFEGYHMRKTKKDAKAFCQWLAGGSPLYGKLISLGGQSERTVIVNIMNYYGTLRNSFAQKNNLLQEFRTSSFQLQRDMMNLPDDDLCDQRALRMGRCPAGCFGLSNVMQCMNPWYEDLYTYRVGCETECRRRLHVTNSSRRLWGGDDDDCVPETYCECKHADYDFVDRPDGGYVDWESKKICSPAETYCKNSRQFCTSECLCGHGYGKCDGNHECAFDYTCEAPNWQPHPTRGNWYVDRSFGGTYAEHIGLSNRRQICLPTHDMFDVHMVSRWGNVRWSPNYHYRDWTGHSYWNVAGRCANDWGEVDDEVIDSIKNSARYCKAPDHYGVWGDDGILRFNIETKTMEEAAMKNDEDDLMSFMCSIAEAATNRCPEHWILWGKGDDARCYRLYTEGETPDRASVLCKEEEGTNDATEAEMWPPTTGWNEDNIEFIQTVLIRNHELSLGHIQDTYAVWKSRENQDKLVIKSLTDEEEVQTERNYYICVCKPKEEVMESADTHINLSPETKATFLAGQDGYPHRGEPAKCKCEYGWAGDYCERKQCPAKGETNEHAPVVSDFLDECHADDIHGHCSTEHVNAQGGFSCKCDDFYGPSGGAAATGSQPQCPFELPLFRNGHCVRDEAPSRRLLDQKCDITFASLLSNPDKIGQIFQSGAFVVYEDEDNDHCCTVDKPCSYDEGDCDSDDECEEDLVCAQTCPWNDDNGPDECCGPVVPTHAPTTWQTSTSTLSGNTTVFIEPIQMACDGCADNSIPPNLCMCPSSFYFDDDDTFTLQLLGSTQQRTYAKPTVSPTSYLPCAGSDHGTCLLYKTNFNGVIQRRGACHCDPAYDGVACTCPKGLVTHGGYSNGHYMVTEELCNGHGACCPHGDHALHDNAWACQAALSSPDRYHSKIDGCYCEPPYAGPACTCIQTVHGICGGKERASPYVNRFLNDQYPRGTATEEESGCGITDCMCNSDYTGYGCGARIGSMHVINGKVHRQLCGFTGDRGDIHPDTNECVCNSIDDVSLDGSSGEFRRKFSGTACQCANIKNATGQWNMCSGHGTCIEPTMPWGRCSFDDDSYINLPEDQRFWNEAHYSQVRAPYMKEKLDLLIANLVSEHDKHQAIMALQKQRDAEIDYTYAFPCSWYHPGADTTTEPLCQHQLDLSCTVPLLGEEGRCPILHTWYHKQMLPKEYQCVVEPFRTKACMNKPHHIYNHRTDSCVNCLDHSMTRNTLPDGRPDYFHCNPMGKPEFGEQDFCTATYETGGTWSFGGDVDPGTGTCLQLHNIKTVRNLNVDDFEWSRYNGTLLGAHTLIPNITKEKKCKEACLFQDTCTAMIWNQTTCALYTIDPLANGQHDNAYETLRALCDADVNTPCDWGDTWTYLMDANASDFLTLALETPELGQLFADNKVHFPPTTSAPLVLTTLDYGYEDVSTEPVPCVYTQERHYPLNKSMCLHFCTEEAMNCDWVDWKPGHVLNECRYSKQCDDDLPPSQIRSAPSTHCVVTLNNGWQFTTSDFTSFTLPPMIINIVNLSPNCDFVALNGHKNTSILSSTAPEYWFPYEVDAISIKRKTTIMTTPQTRRTFKRQTPLRLEGTLDSIVSQLTFRQDVCVDRNCAIKSIDIEHYENDQWKTVKSQSIDPNDATTITISFTDEFYAEKIRLSLHHDSEVGWSPSPRTWTVSSRPPSQWEQWTPNLVSGPGTVIVLDKPRYAFQVWEEEDGLRRMTTEQVCLEGEHDIIRGEQCINCAERNQVRSSDFLFCEDGPLSFTREDNCENMYEGQGQCTFVECTGAFEVEWHGHCIDCLSFGRIKHDRFHCKNIELEKPSDDTLFTYWQEHMSPFKCSNDWQCQTFGLGHCVYGGGDFEPWRNGGVDNKTITKYGDEGGCECLGYPQSHWDDLLFCEDCLYGFGPREATGDYQHPFELTDCDRSLYDMPDMPDEPKACGLPFGLDPVLAAVDGAYKLCAGHGTYKNGACNCFNDNKRGHWAPDREDGASIYAPKTCRVCVHNAYGPKPKNVADAQSREIQLDSSFVASHNCYEREQAACNQLGSYDPDKFWDTPQDNTWHTCSNHGDWNKEPVYTCDCHRGWVKVDNTGDDYADMLNYADVLNFAVVQSCNRCHRLFGPPVGGTPKFCLGPWWYDPVPPRQLVAGGQTDNASTPTVYEKKLCSGHGTVSEHDKSSCDCFQNLVDGFWSSTEHTATDIVNETISTCNLCSEGWGPPPLDGLYEWTHDGWLFEPTEEACTKLFGPEPTTGEILECAGHGTYTTRYGCICDPEWSKPNDLITELCTVCNHDNGWGPLPPNDHACSLELFGFDPVVVANPTVNATFPDDYKECFGHGNILGGTCVCDNDAVRGGWDTRTTCATCILGYFSLEDGCQCLAGYGPVPGNDTSCSLEL